MRFKIDENLPTEVAQALASLGHDALTVADQGMSGLAGPAIAQVCRTEDRSIVTLDLDFSDIRRYPPDVYAGIIVLRPVVQTVPLILRMVERAAALLDQQPLKGCLWIVDHHSVRIRDQDPPP